MDVVFEIKIENRVVIERSMSHLREMDTTSRN